MVPQPGNVLQNAADPALEYGTEMTYCLLLTEEELDDRVRAAGLGASQILNTTWRDSYVNDYHDHVGPARVDVVIQTVMTALPNLEVGDPNNQGYKRRRQVDVGALPNGDNIPVMLEWVKYGRDNEDTFEAIFNIKDGVILVTYLPPRWNGNIADCSLNPWVHKENPSDLLAMMFSRLHTANSPQPSKQGGLQRAKEIVRTAIGNGSPLAELPRDSATTWLPVMLANSEHVQTGHVKGPMKSWLNWIVVHVHERTNAYQVIQHFFEQGLHKEIDLKEYLWRKREKATIGEEAFHADDVEGLNNIERSRHFTPVLLFEVLDMTDEKRTFISPQALQANSNQPGTQGPGQGSSAFQPYANTFPRDHTYMDVNY